MSKSSYDLAALLDVIAAKPISESFTAYLTGSWSDLSVAVLDPDVWNNKDGEKEEPVDGAQTQIVRELDLTPAQVVFLTIIDPRDSTGLRSYQNKGQEIRQ